VSDHLIAEANRHANALHQMTLPTTKPNQRDIDWYIAECIDLRRQLEYEIEAKRNHLRIATEEISGLKIKTGCYEIEIARLRAALSRIDTVWMNQEEAYADYCEAAWRMVEIARAAIDAVRKEQP